MTETLSDEEIVIMIDRTTEYIIQYRGTLKNLYKERRLYRQMLEQNHRKKKTEI